MKIKNNSAIALILTVGILAILALIAVGFSAFTRLELRATENFVNQLKAELIAEAGIARAINDLKYHSAYGAKVDPYDTMLDPWFYGSGVNVDLASASSPSYGTDISYGGGTYRLKVIDCASLININTPLPVSKPGAETDLKNMLEQLGLNSIQAQNLIDYRKTLPDGIFSSKEEIKLVPGIDAEDYEAIKYYVSLYGDDDDGRILYDHSDAADNTHTRKNFVNINTASQPVLKAVFRPMIRSASQTDAFVADIISRRSSNPFDGLDPDADVNGFQSAFGEFRKFVLYLNSVGRLSNVKRDAVLLQSDPNQDSTQSTHICFDGGGTYEIEAIGCFRGARKHIRKVVRIYRKIYQTSKDEFESNAASVTRRISWKNSCPVDFTKLLVYNYADDPFDSPNTDDYIYDSLKLGFWDNFSEDYDPDNPNPDASGKLGPWQAQEETFTINQSGDGKLRTWVSGAITYGIDYFPRVYLDENVCKVDDFALVVHAQDETSNSKYPGFRPDLPWPARPREWWFWAPQPDATNCPDIASGLRTQAEVMALRKSIFIHEQYLNVFHIQFGGIKAGTEWMSAIFCNAPQIDDLLTHSIPVYQNWVNYDGTGYIYFTPSPPLGPGWEEWFQTCTKPYSVISGANVMVSCNQWIWSGHPADYGTEYFPLPDPAYRDQKSFHLKGIGRWHTRGEVYFPNIDPVPFVTTEQVMVYEDRYFKFAGMGNFPDIDYVRIVPEQGVYISNLFDPSGGAADVLEWGTLYANVRFPGTADPAREPVWLQAFDSVPTVVPEPDYEPAFSSVILPSGGAVPATASQSLGYSAYLFSDKGETVVNNTDFEQAPVVEDVTITYMPRTQVLYQSKI